MSTPVVTDKWAGNFDCDVCRRKRLQGDEFSKKALERYRKDGGKLKCKQCVATTEEEERAAAAAKRAGAAEEFKDEKRACAICKATKPYSDFNKNQWNKGDGKSKCRPCVEKAIAEEASSQANKNALALQEAREKVAKAQKSGNAGQILAAESELAALEAEKVTGLKPVKMNRGGRGRGRGGRGGGRGRGTSGRGRK